MGNRSCGRREHQHRTGEPGFEETFGVNQADIFRIFSNTFSTTNILKAVLKTVQASSVNLVNNSNLQHTMHNVYVLL